MWPQVLRPDFCSPPAAPLGVSLSQCSCARRLMKASGRWRHRAVDLLRRARRGVSARESGYCELRSVCTSLLNKSCTEAARANDLQVSKRGAGGDQHRGSACMVTAYRKAGVYFVGGGKAGRSAVSGSDWRNVTFAYKTRFELNFLACLLATFKATAQDRVCWNGEKNRRGSCFEVKVAPLSVKHLMHITHITVASLVHRYNVDIVWNIRVHTAQITKTLHEYFLILL